MSISSVAPLPHVAATVRPTAPTPPAAPPPNAASGELGAERGGSSTGTPRLNLRA